MRHYGFVIVVEHLKPVELVRELRLLDQQRTPIVAKQLFPWASISKFWLEGKNRVLSLYLQPPDAHCPKCKSRNVRAHRHKDRTLIGLPNGKCQVRFVVPVRKVVCRDCRTVTYERVAFAAYKNARITRLLAKKLLERAADVSMKSLAEEYRISWRNVRDAIEDGLRKRYRRRDYSTVENIGVDELHVFRNERPSLRFITTVRDQDGKAVLDVARVKARRL